MESFQITVIGCGLIGGSFAMALKRRRPEIGLTCLDTPNRVSALKEAQIADQVGSIAELDRYLPDSKLIVLATPVETILDLLDVIGPHLSPGTIVTDVGSTKTQIVQKAWSVLPPEVVFIGGHPIAGTEQSGVEAADPLLFNERVYLLCPSADTPADALLFLIEIVEDLLAAPVTIEPEEHDRIMATISHLPQLLAMALMHTALEVDLTHGMIEMIAGQGFLNLTRIAASDYSMWEGILKTNKEAIVGALDLLEKSLATVRQSLKDGSLGTVWHDVSSRRRKMSLESMPRHRRPELRKLVDRFDEQILKALGNRIRVVNKIGQLKADQDSPVYDPDRERRLLAKRVEWARACDLPADLVETLFAAIMEHSKQVQSKVSKDKKQ